MACNAIPKEEWAAVLKETFEPAETAFAVPIAYEAVLDAVERPVEFPGIENHPFVKQVLAIVQRHKVLGITPEQSPAYLACWKAAYRNKDPKTGKDQTTITHDAETVKGKEKEKDNIVSGKGKGKEGMLLPTRAYSRY